MLTVSRSFPSSSPPRASTLTILCGAWLSLTACGGGPAPEGQDGESGESETGESDAGESETGDTGLIDPEPNDEAAFLYDQDQFRTYELIIDEADLAFLDADPAAEQYVPGVLRFEGQDYGVGVRYKGSLGAWVGCTEAASDEDPFAVGGAKTCPKLGMKVSFNWADPEGRFFGVKKLLFHAMNLDPSMMRERLGYWLYRQMGVAAPRAVHARLLINGELAGVFLNLEYIDGRFTRSRFADGEGNLYKEVWPTAGSLQAPATEAALLDALRTNKDEDPSVQKLLDFGTAVMSQDGANGADRAEVIGQWMDVDTTMRTIAVDRTIRADDGMFHFYCSNGGCGNHNFYFYEEVETDRVWVIPWDLDNAFVVHNPMYEGTGLDRFVQVVDEWNALDLPCVPHPGSSQSSLLQMPPACDPLMRGWAQFDAEYEAGVGALLDGPFSAEVVEALVDDWDGQIRATVEAAYDADPEQLPPATFDVALADFSERCDLLRVRAAQTIGG